MGLPTSHNSAALPGASVSVVIPCHNQSAFLRDCLNSLALSQVKPFQVVVLDDASDDPGTLAAIVNEFQGVLPVQLERVEFRNVHQTRGRGFELCSCRFILFLDADNKVHPGYLPAAVSQLEADRNAGFVFPVLQAFGDAVGTWAGTGLAPELVTADDVEAVNCVDAGSVFRADALAQSLVFRQSVTQGSGHEDWRVARAVLRLGWYGLRGTVPLLYRIHSVQTSSAFPAEYWRRADLQNETVTVCVAYSGRSHLWTRWRNWFVAESTSWPRVRLLVLNSSHKALTVGQLGLSDWSGEGIQIEKIDAGRPGLADLERRERPGIQRDVETAVAGLYNRAARMISGEYVLFVEDDVLPPAGALRSLMGKMTETTAGVSGVYRHRYQRDKAVAYSLPWNGSMIPLERPGVAFEPVGGVGFGCTLIRRSLLNRFLLSGDDPRAPHYDVAFSASVAGAGFHWILDRTVSCEHFCELLPDPLSQNPATRAD